jgi:hypothetical protein
MSSLFSQSSVNVADLPDQAFESLIKNFLTDILTKRSGMRPESISKYLDNKDNMKQLMSAFTHWSFDPINNYEYYETYNDLVYPSSISLPIKSKPFIKLISKLLVYNYFKQLYISFNFYFSINI